MSYILEALKRSERQRLSTGMAALRAPVYADEARQPPWLLYGAAAAVLIVAGIVVGWLRPWQQGDADSALAPTAPKVAESAPVPKVLALASPAEPAPPARPQPATPRPPDTPRSERIEQVEELRVLQVKPHRARVHAETPAAAQAPPAAPAVAPKVAPPVATIVVTSPAAAQETPVPGGKEQGNPATASTADAAHDVTPGQPSGGNKILALYELPPEVLHAIPAMSISGYSYSATPRERMVGINDRLIQEGQYVADGLKLEEITPDGLIFSYKNYRFLKKLQ